MMKIDSRWDKTMEYSVKVNAFEGPLDLLLHLINRLEIDIYDIPVSQIIEQYLDYIQAMKELQLDIASEYLVMAASLLHIKSKMLLPKQEEILDEEMNRLEMEEDPRDELLNKLLEYRKYKEAAKELQKYGEERSLFYTREPENLTPYKKQQKSLPASSVSLYDMLGAFQKLMERKKYSAPKTSTIKRQELPIEQRMVEVLEELKRRNGERLNFQELFPFPEKSHIVVTFLALLELMKNNRIYCEQEKNFKDIYIILGRGTF
jgi:segregation and condensation protein A